MNLTNPRLLYLKGGLFLFTGILAGVLILVEMPSIKVAALLLVCIWSFARAYYFAFYVVQHYIDGDYRFAGLWDFGRYTLSGRVPDRTKSQGEPPKTN